METVENAYNSASFDEATGFFILHFYEDQMSRTLYIDPNEITGVSSYAKWQHESTIYTKNNGSFYISEKINDVVKLLAEFKAKHKFKRIEHPNYGRE